MSIIFLKTGIRNLLKDKTYSFINIFGLAIGMACVILIYLWIKDELSYDKFHANVDKLYQVQQNWLTQEGLFDRSTSTPYAIADAFREEIPEVQKATQYAYPGRLRFKFNDIIYFEDEGKSVSSEFLTMFSFGMISGNPETALKEPFSIVLTENMAKKYFGKEDPMNKIIDVDENYTFKVTGVLKDIPKNSTLNFEFLVPISFSRTTGRWYDSWDSNSLRTYVLLSDKALVSDVDEKMSLLLREHLKQEWDSDPTNAIARAGYALASLKKLHLYRWGDYETGLANISYVYIFAVIALFILVIASINFMNLSIARSLKRCKDIGVRKVSGAKRYHLIRQFLGESFIFTILAIIISLCLVFILLPAFNNLTQKEITTNFFRNIQFISLLMGVIGITTMLSGGYPALFLSSFKPVKVLKGNKLTDNSGIIFRKGLVVFQFVVSIWLIVGTILVVKQLKFMQNKNLGMEKNQVMYLEVTGMTRKYYNTLKEELAKHSGINKISGVNDLPVRISSDTDGYTWQNKDRSRDFNISYCGVDYDFFETMDIKFLEGRPYSKDIESDKYSSYIINETAMKQMGFESAVDLSCEFWGRRGKIIGVVKDFHFRPMDEEIRPLMMLFRPHWVNYLLINIKTGHFSETKKYIEKTWKEVTAGNPINLKFMDESMQDFYEREVRTSNLLKVFSLLSIFIACLGLFGLASFMIQNRTKEIGVRKVNGAKAIEIVKLLNIDFTLWMFVSLVIASPIAYLAVQKWLTNFAYRTQISWWIFAFSGILAIVITFVTVSWQSWMAARRNPVEALRYE